MQLRNVLSLLAIAVVVGLPLAASAHPPKDAAPAGFTIKGDAENGKKLFVANCATCHGKKGAGDGIAAAVLNPHPANFNDAKLFKEVTDWEIYNAVKGGGPAVGLNVAMPAWGATLHDDEIQNVVAYLKLAFIEPARKAAAAAPPTKP